MNPTAPLHDSLVSALARARIPAENHQFIARMAMAVGIAEYRAVERPEKPYVVGKRREHGPDLYIYYGSTDGFRSEDEIVRLLGDSVERGPSSRTGTWYVAHPLNKIRAPSQRRSDKTRTATFCGCGMELSLTGFCASCD